MPSAHIVIADDEPAIVELSKRILTLQLPHAQITAVGDGLAAFDTCIGRHIDLLLTDYHMPGLNGVDLARALRARGRQPLIILMSASEIQVADVYAAGVDIVLAKPWGTDELWAAVQGIDIAEQTHAPHPIG